MESPRPRYPFWQGYSSGGLVPETSIGVSPMNAFPITAPQETFLGVYRATRVLGEGGMGQVFLGRHIKTGQEVVIKVMHDHLAQVPSVRANFQRELSVMMQFCHPYSVRLLAGSLEGPGRPCLVMEYIRG